jgi:hypothetical protein
MCPAKNPCGSTVPEVLEEDTNFPAPQISFLGGEEQYWDLNSGPHHGLYHLLFFCVLDIFEIGCYFFAQAKVNCDPILCFIIGRITDMHPTPTFFFNN